jgi:ADP-ribosylglycohydrolase
MNDLKDMEFRSRDITFNWENFHNKYKNPSGLSQKMRKMVYNFNQTSQSNGSLMRITPLAIWCSRLEDEMDVEAAVKEDVTLTHLDETVIDAAVIYVLAIRFLLNNQGNMNEKGFRKFSWGEN